MPLCNRPKEGFCILSSDSEVTGALLNYDRIRTKFREGGIPVSTIFQFRSKTGFKVHCERDIATKVVGGELELPLSGTFRVVSMRYYLDMKVETESEVDTDCILGVLGIAASCDRNDIEIERILGPSVVRVRVVRTDLWMSLHRLHEISVQSEGSTFLVSSVRGEFSGGDRGVVSKLSGRLDRLESEIKQNSISVQRNSSRIDDVGNHHQILESRFDAFEQRLETRLDRQIDRLQNRLELMIRDVLTDNTCARDGKRRR